MAILNNLNNPSYPEPWHRQTPTGYETNIALLQDGEPIVINDGLALKVFQDYCCNGCSCKSESDHKKDGI
jgi:hypothetical protein